MTLGEIIFQFPNNIKIIIRHLEKLERKQINDNMAILFNRTCINESILPQFDNIYICEYIYIYIHIYTYIFSVLDSNCLFIEYSSHFLIVFVNYSNEECRLRIMCYIGRWTAALSRTYPVELHRSIKLGLGIFLKVLEKLFVLSVIFWIEII